MAAKLAGGVGAMRGRKPKPTAVKELAGNPGKRALNSREPRPGVPASAPRAPRVLGTEARREWRRVVPLLMELGLYTHLDQAAVVMYCQAYGRWVEAERKLAKGSEVLTSENGYEYVSPWRAVANKAADECRRLMVEFGLTPSSRSRLHIEPDEEEPSLAEQLFAMVSERGSGD